LSAERSRRSEKRYLSRRKAWVVNTLPRELTRKPADLHGITILERPMLSAMSIISKTLGLALIIAKAIKKGKK
jgi:hypothetical protein